MLHSGHWSKTQNAGSVRANQRNQSVLGVQPAASTEEIKRGRPQHTTRHVSFNPYNAEMFLYKPRRSKVFFNLKSS